MIQEHLSERKLALRLKPGAIRTKPAFAGFVRIATPLRVLVTKVRCSRIILDNYAIRCKDLGRGKNIRF